ncbi:MAG: inorganic pyrophosphatase [Candidatus Chisholmbacteria bacterium RIFCSPHIGHO2_01_FULL_48_12]|uniref:Inorganic pyrophosphatase n=1 Tax=Candidatus Chisholmbacteria bacterium RIFCSPHIGHO2_01_FULL_48_12 TaxID=1797589 RepID=A0A1G1VLA9_9BACT|nr:MAG: inorganic pyrophosphatase [Candidatus Chisholmbacteria bacterium RIFCSPHIGHO2_01_FULL_48_12]
MYNFIMDYKVFIEIPIGSSVKYEVDETTGELKVDRFLYNSFAYPFNYGYIKDTKGGDGDPMDAVVLSSQPVVPRVVIMCHAIGVLATQDEGGEDAKVIMVPTAKIDPLYGSFQDIKDVPQALLNKIKHFFEHYKDLEPGKWIKIIKWQNAEAAEDLIAKSHV